jgi:phage terminase large subunit GpA-like protein
MRFKHSALAVVASAIAGLVRPAVRQAPSQWAADNLVVPDGPRAGEKWSAALTPYILEPLDFFGPDSGVNEIAVMKSAQTGFTTLAIAAVGHSIDRDPCRIMVVLPTDSALVDFNSEKLQVAIDNSPTLRAKVVPQGGIGGSKTYTKKYPGGALTLAIASSPTDLRSKTIKKLIRDEIDEYSDDLDGQGDPLELSDGRLFSFLASGDWKKLDISTPTVLGSSKIAERYAAGDQRRWHVPCPGCGDEFVFEWGPLFRFKRTFPPRAYYVAPCCGTTIEAHQKVGLVRKGRWIATAPGPGKFPSYHFDTLSSPFVPWDNIAEKHVAAGEDENKLKAFWNIWLGLPYEVRGDAPDHELLMQRREPYPRGEVPAGGLILVASADVQMRGIWYEIVAIGRERQTWVVDVGYCDGDTSAPDGEAFRQMFAATVGRTFRDAWGRERQVDALAVDSGYRSHAVYAAVRNNQSLHPETGLDRILAVKGEDGWGKPAISLPSLVDIDLAGRKVKKGCKLWKIGTWSLKGAFYADLRKLGVAAGRDRDPDGFCHFGTWLDESYFRQITAEYLTEERSRGQVKRIWKVRNSNDNHLLDCRVYNLALAEHLGLSRMSSDDWATLERRRGRPSELPPPLLAVSAPETVAETPPSPVSAPPPAPAPAPRPPARQSWMQPRSDGWMRR